MSGLGVRRLILKSPKWEKKNAQPDVVNKAKRAFKPKTAKLRASITPGTVLILLAGRFRGRRVVFLKQLTSGLLLVSGPFAVNGVPLRRVNQAYVIATSKKVDVSGVKAESITDDLFKVKDEKKKKGEADFFAMKAAKSETSEERKNLQKQVDAAIKLSDVERAYLKSKFSLSRNDRPHEMKF